MALKDYIKKVSRKAWYLIGASLVYRPDAPVKEPETTKVWPIKHDDCPEYHPTVTTVRGGKWR